MNNRVGCAVWGMVLVGGLSVILVVILASTKSPAQLAANNSTSSAQATATATAQAAVSSQATATAAQATASTQPTLAPTSVPTAPVSTQPPSGQRVELQGTITSVDQENHTFDLTRSGTTTTLKVNAGTQYSGTAASFGQIQVGWSAEIHAVRTGGIVIATEVNANPAVNN